MKLLYITSISLIYPMHSNFASLFQYRTFILNLFPALYCVLFLVKIHDAFKS